MVSAPYVCNYLLRYTSNALNNITCLLSHAAVVTVFAFANTVVFCLAQELDDPSGNSYIENKLAPIEDPQLTVVQYARSEEQNLQLGIAAQTVVS